MASIPKGFTTRRDTNSQLLYEATVYAKVKPLARKCTLRVLPKHREKLKHTILLALVKCIDYFDLQLAQAHD